MGKSMMIAGLEEGLLGMRNGGIRRLLIPSSLGYDKNQKLEPVPRNFDRRQRLYNTVNNDVRRRQESEALGADLAGVVLLDVQLINVRPSVGSIKEELARLAAETSGGAAASEAQRAEVLALVTTLEASSSAGSTGGSWAERGPLLQGEWDQVYTDNPEAGTMWSNGKFSKRKLKGPISGRRARAKWALGLTAEMRASVEPQDDGVTWSVSFETFGWALLGGILPLGQRRALPPGAGCEWRMTYVDEEIRVLRSQNNRGGPPTMYVLRRAM